MEYSNFRDYLCCRLKVHKNKGTKVMEKRNKRDAEVAARVHKTMRITGVKKSMVYAVMAGDRKNDLVLSTYMSLQENEIYIENKLTQNIRNLIPF
ncbi:hypothetical protein D3C72_434530 [compost metagenome]